MRVSVVIPCFKERPTIEQIVQAVRASPIANLEMIVVDDGSTDGTVPVLKEKFRIRTGNHGQTGEGPLPNL